MILYLLLVTMLQICKSSTIIIPVRPVIPVVPVNNTCLKVNLVFTSEQGCVDIFENDVCKFGERLYENEVTGVGTCHCEEEFALVHGGCHQVGTRGPCDLNHYLIVQDGVAICEENPCGQSDVVLPREDSTDYCVLYDECEDHLCWSLTGVWKDSAGNQNCLIEETDAETLELGCIISKEVSIFSSVKPKRCNRGRIWNRRRGRCVRRFRG